MKTKIAMRCTQEQWDSIKDHFDVDLTDNFKNYPYLVNNYAGNYLNIGNSAIPEQLNRQIHETFDAKIFLEACGIETFTVSNCNTTVIMQSDNYLEIAIEQPSLLELNGINGEEILRFNPNGDIFLKGKLIENDKELADAFREFLKQYGYLK